MVMMIMMMKMKMKMILLNKGGDINKLHNVYALIHSTYMRYFNSLLYINTLPSSQKFTVPHQNKMQV